MRMLSVSNQELELKYSCAECRSLLLLYCADLSLIKQVSSQGVSCEALCAFTCPACGKRNVVPSSSIPNQMFLCILRNAV